MELILKYLVFALLLGLGSVILYLLTVFLIIPYKKYRYFRQYRNGKFKLYKFKSNPSRSR